MSALIVVALVLVVLFTWQPILLGQILFPPIVDRGYHSTDQWLNRRRDYWKAHPNARCRVTFRRAGTTWTLVSFRWDGLVPRLRFFQRTKSALHLHEAVYPRNRRTHVHDMWLFPMTPDAHRRLHNFDRALWPTLTLGLWKDRRNRLLWLSTLLYIYGRYALLLVPVLIWLKVR